MAERRSDGEPEASSPDTPPDQAVAPAVEPGPASESPEPVGVAPSPSSLPNSTAPGTTQPAGARRSGRQVVTFAPLVLDRTVIAVPLLAEFEEWEEIKERALKKQRKRPQTRATKLTPDEEESLKPEVYGVIIDVNLEYRGGRDEARKQVRRLVSDAIKAKGENRDASRQGVNDRKSQYSQQYLFAKLEREVIRHLVRIDGGNRADAAETGATATTSAADRAIYRIWPDFPVNALTTRSVKTVKADAARIAYAALGEDVVWAVLDSGIQGDHPHFALHANLKHQPPLKHRDFTSLGDGDGEQEALVDQFGHGTHVAGILAGEQVVTGEGKGVASTGGGSVPADSAGAAMSATTNGNSNQAGIRAFTRYRNELGDVKFEPLNVREISGVAPRTKLLSLKVLDENGDGDASSLIAALEYIQEVNGYGRRLRIHGVNMSVGYQFKPEWFACGQSPLCVEVDRLVRSGVVVVVAAGNTGYGWVASEARGSVPAGMDLTINDPGNAELAITVGATHRDMPHIYGVSYFSSKGPTGDGRLKPDLVAHGEKILSCGAGKKLQEAQAAVGAVCNYIEDSGTSMAAPHVSGAIAAFLSIRREFIGQPEKVKEIFLSTCTDLKRDRSFQGQGLVDLIRAIQSV